MNRAETLQQLAWLCRNGRTAAEPVIETSGWTELDAVLPGGGWQSGTIVELMPAAVGIGELSLLLPALARITKAERHVTLIAPPYIPFATALSQHGVRLERLLVIQAQQAEDILWATEQSLRCRSFGAVVAWPAAKIRDREIRRLQLAAEAGGCTGFLYRSVDADREASPAALRLKLRRVERALQIDVVKCRGGRSGMSVKVEAPCSGCA
jgi:cell division inhibitor SulA/protein ImuA